MKTGSATRIAAFLGLAAVGSFTPDYAEIVSAINQPMQLGKKPSRAAHYKRAAKKRANVRARGKK